MNKKLIIYSLFFVLHISTVYAETIQNGCDNVRYHEIQAVWQINEYTCKSGEFLPANTDGCKKCPDGHVCNGGTFTFNPERSQGIQYGNFEQNTPFACSSNMPALLKAVYEPVTVTLNFDDDNGHTTWTTCSYNGLVNLPESPTREGYDFVGWKVVQTNNE